MGWMIANGIAGSYDDVRMRRCGVGANDVKAGAPGTFGQVRGGEHMEVTRRIEPAPMLPKPPVPQAGGVRGGHDEPACWLEYPLACHEKVQRIWHMLDDVIEGDRVECVGRKIGAGQIAVMEIQPMFA